MLLTVTAILVLGSATGWAQSIKGEPADLKFEVINATTGQPGTIERLLIQYSATSLSPILDIQPEGSTFDVMALPVLGRGKYIMTAWCQGVPYYWSLRGNNLLETPVRIHVFDTTTGVDEVALTGLNLLMRKTESLLEMEFMLQIENRARPQISLVGDPYLRLKLPREVKTATLIYGNGPDPQEKELTGLTGGMVALEAPLTSGRNIMRLKTTIAWTEGMEIPISANVPIEAWSLMVTPEGLDIQSFDLEPTDSSEIRGYSRYKGPALEADGSFSFRISSSPGAGAEEDLFTQSTDEVVKTESKPAEKEQEKDKGFPFVVLTPIFIVILVIIVSKRRRS